MTISYEGYCPVCESKTTFESANDWFRDNLRCSNCSSIPRERAFALVQDRFLQGWENSIIHESSPADRLVSNRMKKKCRRYLGSQFFPDLKAGEKRNGFQCENLEALSFGSECIDLHCHLDVLEHVNHPEKCFAEMERTLRPGGAMLFSVPVFEGKLTTERKAYYDENNKVHFLGEPEYHGNPIDDDGAPVTFHYGQDFTDLILMWTQNCGVEEFTFNDPFYGVLGKFREIFLVTKRR